VAGRWRSWVLLQIRQGIEKHDQISASAGLDGPSPGRGGAAEQQSAGVERASRVRRCAAGRDLRLFEFAEVPSRHRGGSGLVCCQADLSVLAWGSCSGKAWRKLLGQAWRRVSTGPHRVAGSRISSSSGSRAVGCGPFAAGPARGRRMR